MKEIISPDEFQRAMQRLADENFDPEISHSDADRLLCKVLEQLGYGKGVAVFRSLKIWYS